MEQTGTAPTPAGHRPALSAAKRQLIHALRNGPDRAPASAGPVERLRPGDGPAIVLVHPVGGQIFSYLELVRRLPAHLPVVGLAADGKLGTDPGSTLVGLAGHYLGRLASAGISPLVLVGWSFGGVVCYEMAHQLAAAGEVHPVVMLDSELVPPDRTRNDENAILGSFTYDLVRATGHRPDTTDLAPEAWFWNRPPPEALKLATDHLAARGMAVTLPLDELLAHYRVYRAAYRALHAYRPRPYPHPVHLLQAVPGHRDLASDWRAVSRSLRVRLVATDHYALMRQPAVEQAVRLVREVAAEASPAS